MVLVVMVPVFVMVSEADFLRIMVTRQQITARAIIYARPAFVALINPPAGSIVLCLSVIGGFQSYKIHSLAFHAHDSVFYSA
jgi:hypothetical protein